MRVVPLPLPLYLAHEKRSTVCIIRGNKYMEKLRAIRDERFSWISRRKERRRANIKKEWNLHSCYSTLFSKIKRPHGSKNDGVNLCNFVKNLVKWLFQERLEAFASKSCLKSSAIPLLQTPVSTRSRKAEKNQFWDHTELKIHCYTPTFHTFLYSTSFTSQL